MFLDKSLDKYSTQFLVWKPSVQNKEVKVTGEETSFSVVVLLPYEEDFKQAAADRFGFRCQSQDVKHRSRFSNILYTL